MATVTQLEVRELPPGKGQLEKGTLFKKICGGEEEREREDDNKSLNLRYMYCLLQYAYTATSSEVSFGCMCHAQSENQSTQICVNHKHISIARA